MTTTALPADVRARSARGFWSVAVAFLVVMSFMTVPTPLYGLYAERNGFGPFTVTVIFAAYGAGVLLGLLTLGHVSDRIGRRPLLLSVVVLEAVCAVAFAFLADTGWLVLLRFVTGFGVGGLSATATAQLSELHERWRHDGDPVVGRTVANVANLGGLAIGPFVAALLSLGSHPLSTPYVVYAVLLVVAVALLWQAPETVPSETREQRWRYRVQKVSVDPEVRGPFVGAAIAALAGFAVIGFITSLTGQFLSQVVGATSRVETGAVATGILLGGVLSQVALAKVARRRQLLVGAALVAVGAVVVAVAALVASLPVFLVGGFLAAGGNGLVFAAALATVAGLAAPHRRGETLAALFLAGYLGITLPVVAVGALLLAFDVVPVLVGFALLVAVAVPAGIAMLVRQTDR